MMAKSPDVELSTTPRPIDIAYCHNLRVWLEIFVDLFIFFGDRLWELGLHALSCA
ncbi:MAG: hypothetical protein F6J87_07190 [Spirulina sp. SIO3F2]|nr:hypothetical protein [Spirulina sp. SIO3F2]